MYADREPTACSQKTRGSPSHHREIINVLPEKKFPKTDLCLLKKVNWKFFVDSV